MDLLPLFQWCEESGLGRTVRESVWAFAVIESVHLLALAMMGGAVLLVDMRMLNLGMRQRPVAELAAEAQRFQNVALVVLIISGIGLFASEAVKCYYSVPFSVKMVALFIAIIFTYTIRKRVAFSSDDSGSARMAVALVSVALWFTVAASGRWIGFSG
jgi:uncharacterized protein DUF6644